MDPASPAAAQAIAPALFQLGMITVFLSAILWYITGFIGGRNMAKRIFMWGAIITGLSFGGAAAANAIMAGLSDMPRLLAFIIVTIIFGFMCLGIFGLFARLFMPSEAANAMVGDLAASLVRAVFVPFRGAFRAVRRLIAGSSIGP